MMSFTSYLSTLKEYGLISRGGIPGRYRCPLEINTHRTAHITPEQVTALDTALSTAQRMQIDIMPFIQYYINGKTISQTAKMCGLSTQQTSKQIERIEYLLFGMLTATANV